VDTPLAAIHTARVPLSRRTLTQLPIQLHKQASTASAVARDLEGLASHCPSRRGRGRGSDAQGRARGTARGGGRRHARSDAGVAGVATAAHRAVPTVEQLRAFGVTPQDLVG
jgi:hypothetical protein